MLNIWLEWDCGIWQLWPLVSNCTCESATGKRIRLPFFSLFITREKVVA